VSHTVIHRLRDPRNSRVGFSDIDARVGKAPGGKRLGYKSHLATVPRHEFVVGLVVAPANQNEKRHAVGLVGSVGEALKSAGKELRRVLADGQYSSRRFRDLLAGEGVEVIIPHPSSQPAKGRETFAPRG